jgi:hypothetical protein
MPLIAYSCECKHVNKKFVRSASQAPASLICANCGKEVKKSLSAPSSLSKIVVDNGLQARAVEIVPNIVEINEERANKDYRNDD